MNCGQLVEGSVLHVKPPCLATLEQYAEDCRNKVLIRNLQAAQEDIRRR